MAGRSANNTRAQRKPRPAFPFAAIVGQEEMKLALLLNVIAPTVGGVLVMGHRGTGKSTAVRALADLLPPLTSVRGCAYNCDPEDEHTLCDECAARSHEGKLSRERRQVPIVELPLGATEDRVCGTIDFGRALNEGVKSFEPGLLARANRGFLYIDEVNLLEDHLVDLLLDVAATGRNRVEREGVSVEHPARFVPVGSGNPEEGELRPQLVDRFGLCVEVETVSDLESRVLIVELRDAFDRDPADFVAEWQDAQTKLRRRVVRAARNYEQVRVPRALLRSIAEICLRLGIDGHRGEITVARAARALAAFEGRSEATSDDVRRVAAMSLRHRLRRDPLEHGGGGERVQTSVAEVLGASSQTDAGEPGDGSGARRRSNDKAVNGSNVADDSNASRANGTGDRRGKQQRAEFGEDGRADFDNGGGEAVIAPVELSLREETVAPGFDGRKPSASTKPATRRRAGALASSSGTHGRYSGSTASKTAAAGVALDATLRAAAVLYAGRAAGQIAPSLKLKANARDVVGEAVRYKRLRAKAGALFIFVIDTSGSMALNRIAQAKGALAHLLRRSYVSRDRVSLISFRERGSELLLAPSRSATRARSLLDALPVGGATPLAAGLLRALEVSRRSAAESSSRIQLVVFTDGRANVPLNCETNGTPLKERIKSEITAIGAALRKEGVASFVIDTQSRFTSGGEGRYLADALGGRYAQLPQLIDEGTFSRTLKMAGV